MAHMSFSLAKSTFRCLSCGETWTATTQNVLRVSGCPRCADDGFDPSAPAVLYYLRVLDPEDERVYYKVGVSNRFLEERFPNSEDRTRITIIRKWPFESGSAARERERQILLDYSAFNAGFTTFGPLTTGNTELFPVDILGLDTLS